MLDLHGQTAYPDVSQVKFFFLWKNLDGDWVRDATKPEDFAGLSFDAAYEHFWSRAHAEQLPVLYSGAVYGNPDDVSDGESDFGDAFRWEPEDYTHWLDAFDRTPDPVLWYTVFGVWDTGRGWCRNVDCVQAKSALHAELIWRQARYGHGDVLVSAVTEGALDNIQDGKLYATETGEPEGSPEELEADRIAAGVAEAEAERAKAERRQRRMSWLHR